MSGLSFSLSPETVSRFHDAILCLAKFSETVDLEARQNKLLLSTLNVSRTAYAAFIFEYPSFFESYSFRPAIGASTRPGIEGGQFTCQLYNRALLSVFKAQLRDLRDRDTGISKCNCELRESRDDIRCRFVLEMLCKHGVTKTYELTYEPVEVQRAQFRKDTSHNLWTISALQLRSFVDYFGLGTEQLDISTEDGRATFSSYAEKVVNGKEILKKPMQTSITIDNLDFDEFNVEDQLHVGIMLKDFKSIAVHAESLKASVSACYSVPNQPMQITYTEFGIACEFTLATFGDHRESAVTPARTSVGRPSMVGPKGQSIKRNSAREPSQNHRTVLPDAPERSMPPPALSRNKDPQSRLSPKGTSGRASPPPPKPSVDPESLFYSQHDEEDQRWNEKSWDQDEDQVGWSANARPGRPVVGSKHSAEMNQVNEERHPEKMPMILPATQRLSQIEDFFGD